LRFCAQVAPTACTVSVTLDFNAVAWIQETHKQRGASNSYSIFDAMAIEHRYKMRVKTSLIDDT